MEKRFFLALLLAGGVMLLTPRLFPRPDVPAPVAAPVAAAVADTSRAGMTAPTASASGAPAVASGAGASVSGGTTTPRADSVPALHPESLTVRTRLAEYFFSTLGAAPFAVQADSYPALNGKGGRVVLKHGREPLLRFRVVTPHDTIPLDRMVFSARRDSANGGAGTLTFTAVNGTQGATVTYTFTPNNYLATTTVQVAGVSGPAFLLVDLPHGFDTQEADSADDIRHLAFAVKPETQGARGTAFAKLDPGEKKLEVGPLTWAVAKSKYFLVGILAPKGGRPIAEAHLEGGVRTGKLATTGTATLVLPLDNTGRATFELYTGPQSWRRLLDVGRDFETANPYGGWLQPVVQPFATLVMSVLLWLKKQVRLEYGWVLVIFGVGVRLLMWPLNQKAMRTSLQMQRVQPELTAAQARYKNDPQKQQQEMMRIYKEHGMSPFSAFSGCLPALIPMPVLMALFFVFQNTIEFRGVPFLYLHDISLHDPHYILPLLMGASMFLLSWIGMRNVPPNPQAKMMSYMFPVMLTFFLLNTAAGLSLYYFVQNLAALPQQWLISHERAKANAART